jgi:membrane dipeptidase
MKFAALFLFPCLLIAQDSKAEAALRHARQLLKNAPLVDGHNDLPWEIREQKNAPCDVEAYDLRKKTPGETDLKRLKEGQLAAQFWSIYVPGEAPTKAEGYAKVQLEQFDIARRMIARYPDALIFATRADDIAKARKQGKVASFLGMEGGHVLENSLGALRVYYDLGARYMTLTHNVTLDWADAALDEPKHKGLSPFGKEVVREMNRLGMMVDISHVSPDVMRDAMDASAAPVIFSHSCAYAIVAHPRNVPDDMLKRLKENGGVCMVTFVPPFVSEQVRAWGAGLEKLTKGLPFDDSYKRMEADYIKANGPAPRATLKQVADHIDHVAKVAGVDHVGIAGDYWGGDTPQGLEDVSKYPYLFAELIQRGWKDEDLKKLAGDNLIRVFKRVESVSMNLKKIRKPSTARIENMDVKK